MRSLGHDQEDYPEQRGVKGSPGSSRRRTASRAGPAATDAQQLIAPTLTALAPENVLLIAVGVKAGEPRGLDRVPDNARLEAFVPFEALMPHVDLYTSYPQRARRLQAALAQHDAPAEAAALLERLADTQRPFV